MPKIILDYKDIYSAAKFEGVLQPAGISGYEFSGTLSASARLDRSTSPFDNAIRLGHGGTVGKYTELEFKFRHDLDELVVKASGTREPNDTVDFRLEFNEGINGEFHNKAEITCVVGGPPQKVSPVYIVKDSFGAIHYNVLFVGVARADGPTGFVIEGVLEIVLTGGALTTQYATFGYKPGNGSWVYKTFNDSSPRQDIKVFGSRRTGENIQLVVGATSKVANLYGYGDVVSCELPELF